MENLQLEKYLKGRTLIGKAKVTREGGEKVAATGPINFTWPSDIHHGDCTIYAGANFQYFSRWLSPIELLRK